MSVGGADNEPIPAHDALLSAASIPSAQFLLAIKLGNDAMITPGDLAAALDRLSHKVALLDGYVDEQGTVMDLNGNSVGTWTVEWPECEIEGDASGQWHCLCHGRDCGNAMAGSPAPFTCQGGEYSNG
jgi:hypothetical protein